MLAAATRGESQRVIRVNMKEYIETCYVPGKRISGKREARKELFCAKHGLSQNQFELLRYKVGKNQFEVIS